MKSRGLGQDWLFGIILLTITFAAYLPVLHGSFIWDDSVMVQDNHMLRSAQGLRDFWTTTKAVDPLPLTMTALWLQWQAWDGQTFGYHVIGVLLHGIAALLFWRLLRRFTPRPALAWLGAMIFALHPVAVASAGWISEQKNTLSIIFYLAAIHCYGRFENKKWVWYVLALLCFACALLSKGSVVMLPVVLLLMVWWLNKKLAAMDVVRTVPFFILSLADSLFTIWIQNHKAIGGSMVQNVSGVDRLADAARVVCFYAWKDVLPVNLCVIYPVWREIWIGWIALLILVAVFVVCWRSRKSWGRHVLLGMGCFVVTLFPVMGFFDMYFLVYSRVADHWQYLALPALIGLAVCGGGYWFERASAKFHFPTLLGPTIAAVLLLGLFAATWRRAGVYANEQALWADTIQKNPEAWMAWNNLGNAYAAANQSAAAIDAYEKAISINTNFPDAESNLGNALVAKGEVAGALVHLQKAVVGEPRMAKFHFNYGVGLAQAGRLGEAMAEYQKSLEQNPAQAGVRNNLAHLLYQLKRYNEALEQARLASQIDPNLPEPYLNAAKILAAMNQTTAAAGNFDTFLRMRPDNAGAHFEYGMMLAMHGNLTGALPQFQDVVRLAPNDSAGHGSLGNTFAALHRLPEATEEFRAALQLAPNDAENHNNLANALAEQGKLAEALPEYAAAVKLNPDDAGTRANYAVALARAGQRDEAVVQLREALRLKPGDPALQQELNTLSHP